MAAETHNQPALIVGLGPTGGRVVRELAGRLADLYDTAPGVKLLTLDVGAAPADAPAVPHVDLSVDLAPWLGAGAPPLPDVDGWFAGGHAARRRVSHAPAQGRQYARLAVLRYLMSSLAGLQARLDEMFTDMRATYRAGQAGRQTAFNLYAFCATPDTAASGVVADVLNAIHYAAAGRGVGLYTTLYVLLPPTEGASLRGKLDATHTHAFLRETLRFGPARDAAGRIPPLYDPTGPLAGLNPRGPLYDVLVAGHTSAEVSEAQLTAGWVAALLVSLDGDAGGVLVDNAANRFANKPDAAGGAVVAAQSANGLIFPHGRYVETWAARLALAALAPWEAPPAPAGLLAGLLDGTLDLTHPQTGAAVALPGVFRELATTPAAALPGLPPGTLARWMAPRTADHAWLDWRPTLKETLGAASLGSFAPHQLTAEVDAQLRGEIGEVENFPATGGGYADQLAARVAALLPAGHGALVAWADHALATHQPGAAVVALADLAARLTAALAALEGAGPSAADVGWLADRYRAAQRRVYRVQQGPPWNRGPSLELTSYFDAAVKLTDAAKSRATLYHLAACARAFLAWVVALRGALEGVGRWLWGREAGSLLATAQRAARRQPPAVPLYDTGFADAVYRRLLAGDEATLRGRLRHRWADADGTRLVLTLDETPLTADDAYPRWVAAAAALVRDRVDTLELSDWLFAGGVPAVAAEASAAQLGAPPPTLAYDRVQADAVQRLHLALPAASHLYTSAYAAYREALVAAVLAQTPPNFTRLDTANRRALVAFQVDDLIPLAAVDAARAAAATYWRQGVATRAAAHVFAAEAAWTQVADDLPDASALQRLAPAYVTLLRAPARLAEFVLLDALGCFAPTPDASAYTLAFYADEAPVVFARQGSANRVTLLDALFAYCEVNGPSAALPPDAERGTATEALLDANAPPPEALALDLREIIRRMTGRARYAEAVRATTRIHLLRHYDPATRPHRYATAADREGLAVLLGALAKQREIQILRELRRAY